MKIFDEAKVPVQWDVQYVGKEVDPRTNSFITRENLDSVLVRPAPAA
jgi:isocitrate dehydrogenase (NAD+)